MEAGKLSARSAKLSKFFGQVENGNKRIAKGADARLFLEALCDQTNHARCIERLISSSHAFEAIQSSLRFDVSISFLNGPAESFLKYLRDPELGQLCNGQFLRKIILSIVDPPAFWDALVTAFTSDILSEASQSAFAWLLLQVVVSPSCPTGIAELAKHLNGNRKLLDSPSIEIRTIGYKLNNVLNTTSTDIPQSGESGPGGRHDNDFENFRKISILPTPDEIESTEAPFYRKADEIYDVEAEHRPAMHHDNQFRLLRDDLLAELKDDLQVARGQKKGKRSATLIDGLALHGIECQQRGRNKPCSLVFECKTGLSWLTRRPYPERVKTIAETRNFLKHRSLGCILQDREIVAFATVCRNESLLAEDVPKVVLDVSGQEPLMRLLQRAINGQSFRFIVVDAPVFAYEPILEQLQKKTDFPLSECILSPEPSLQPLELDERVTNVIREIEAKSGQMIHSSLGVQTEISLDRSQMKSLLTALRHSLSLIQGPPGTGKSFIGALLAKVLHDSTKETILVLCYTNHALDQFLEDLMRIGIPDRSMVRLGSKSTEKTKRLALSEQTAPRQNSKYSWSFVNERKSDLVMLELELQAEMKKLREGHVSRDQILEYLEFSEDSDFYEAFLVSDQDDEMEVVGKKGKRVNKHYLWDQWVAGRDAGVLRHTIQADFVKIWSMPPQDRKEVMNSWINNVSRERLEKFVALFERYNRTEQELAEYFYHLRDSEILRQKRIIGCTTTAAAKYTRALQAAEPGIILVEEAGEILESHILTAITSDTKQMVLIGDHKQLRPKINNYNLTVEKGTGFDLNRSLFERLILRGYPHTTLARQYRMRPEISQFVRHLTYPDLTDGDKTKNRPDLRGFQDNMIFFSHEHMEADLNGVSERRDPTTRGSKQNHFEVDMVLKCIRYLGQQGYGTEKIVVLTPYLGQLHLLKEALSKTNDPVLNDLDSYDLVRAGLISPASAKLSKRQIRISTIDNYQGEESEIVVASLTRSNTTGDVGFMAAPERLNVLLSRARDAMIMIGNANTFLNSRKGKTTWQPFFDLLKEKGHLHDGFPVKCERHPARTAMLSDPNQFDIQCPDGGCSDPCTSLLNCGTHACPQRCHPLYDHSKMKCDAIMNDECSKKHKYSWRCYKGRPKLCPKCDAEAEAAERRKKRDFDLEIKRQAIQMDHARKLAEVQQKIDEQHMFLKDLADEKDRTNTLSQKLKDLENLKTTAIRVMNQQRQEHTATPKKLDSSLNNAHTPAMNHKDRFAASGSNSHQGQNISNNTSSASDEWQRQKAMEGQSNEAIESLMGMIGLEEVKERFLSIKAKVETVVRQNSSLKDERFSAALLGNPGTGKTTVARLYAKFLSSVGVIPGGFFVESTGSRLASDGIPACKKHLEEICNNGGGALFIDEAYQLTSKQNYGGSQVLDFLLAEVENLTGKVVFILAGYNKNMEAFFAHNPGIPSRFPVEFQFEDYTDGELLNILHHRIDQKFDGRMAVEDGPGGLYARIVARRIGRGRGRDGFGNARSVHNGYSRIADRQAKRLQQSRRAGNKPDDMLLTKEDLIGPEPSSVFQDNLAWTKLQSLTGLSSVKSAVQALFDTIQFNYQRELEEKPLVEYSLNKVFVGNPGTGKTTVAKLYGRLLADLGFLSNGEVVVKNPSDFVGDVLGASETTTKGILASTLGKVLVIDEAYMLYGGSSSTGTSSSTDLYKTAVIDIIVAEIQSVPGDDRCVLLLGYKDQMETMFANVNPGLSRRFPMASAFTFDDYSDDDLQTILDLKLSQAGFDVTDEAKKVVRDCLTRARNRPHFGNAGEIDILLDKAKLKHQQRLSARETRSIDTLEPLDFDPDWDRAQRSQTNCKQLFEGVVGCEKLIERLEGYQRTVTNMKILEMDPREQIPFNFLFRGPSGTGKTSTARRMGKIFYDMGFLSTDEVVECSATDLVGQYVGHTGPKTQALLDKALGKVLFIDEAYRLADGKFATEAMDELVDCLTKPKFSKKLITILAGYDADINRLMSINPGLTSRFPETMSFENLTPAQCLELFQKCFQKYARIDSMAVQSPSKTFEETLLASFKHLSGLVAWGNARDIETLASTIISKALSATSQNNQFAITYELVEITIQNMVSERESRMNNSVSSNVIGHSRPANCMPPPLTQNRPPSPIMVNSNATKKAQQEPSSPAKELPEPDHQNQQRDPGVSDEDWQQLQIDKTAAEDRERRLQEIATEEQETQRQLVEKTAAEARAKQMIEEEADAERRRSLEAERLKREHERRKYEETLDRIRRERAAREEQKRIEEKAQQKLREMGVCIAGFRWIKQANGYRCAGGSHFISNAKLGL